MKRKITLLLLSFVTALSSLFLICCGETPECQHNWVKDHTEVVATCVVEGKDEYVCTKCNEKEVRSTGFGEHSFTNYESDGNATCTADGTKTAKCDHCDETHTIPDVGSKLSHTFDREIVDDKYLASEATCTDKATYYYSCSCGEKGTETFEYGETLPHTFDKEVVDDKYLASEATCTDKATYYYSCSCGEKGTETFEYGELVSHDMYEIVVPKTCLTNGSVTHKCHNCEYEDVEILYAEGHIWDRERTCELGHSCLAEGCNASEPALGHNYKHETEEPTCEEQGYTKHTCSRCNDEYYSDYTAPLGHNLEDEDYHVDLSKRIVADGDDYCYIEVYVGHCDRCDKDIEREIKVVEHSYVKSLTKVATCQEDGEYTYTCSICGNIKTESYSDADAHAWDEGEQNGAITVFHCKHKGCNGEKTVVKAETQVDIDSSVWESVNSVEFNDATISLDEATLNQVKDKGNVNVSANSYSKEDVVGLSAEDKDKIGENNVYDFAITSEGTSIGEFSGKVTVRIPYELQPDDDPDNITIFWLCEKENGEQELVMQQTRYENGCAVFEAEHFSLYTVTRTTAAERCAKFGHIETTTMVEPTCVLAGYEITVCSRCGAVTKTFIPALGHEYEDVIEQPTCTEAGKITHTCIHEGCDSSYFEIIPALGHEFEVVEREGATCTSEGYTVFKCVHEGCEETYKKVIAKKAHNYKTTVVEPTCETEGYTIYECKDCGHKYIGNRKSSLNHNYQTTYVEFTCTTDGYTLHTCSRCGDEYVTDIIEAHHVWDIEEPTCGRDQVCIHCGEIGLLATGEHHMENGICTVCGHGCEHEYSEQIIEPTCTEMGYTLKTCDKCGDVIKTDFVEELGHVGDFVCEVCGTSLIPEDLFANALKGLLESNVLLKLNSLELSMGDYIVVLNDVELSISFNENGLGCVGHGFAKTSVFGSQIGSMEAYIQVVGDKCYLCLDADDFIEGVSSNNSLRITTMNGKRLLVGDFSTLRLPTNPLGLTNVAELLNMLAMYKGIIDQNITPVISEYIDTNKTAISKTIVDVVKYFFDIREEDNNYVMTLSFDKIKALNEKLYTYTIEEILDDNFGEGFTSGLITELLSVIYEKNFGQVIDWLAQKGIVITEMLDYVDNLLNVATDGEITSIDSMVNVPIRQMLKDEEFLSTNVIDFISMFMSEFPERTYIEKTVNGFVDQTIYNIVAGFVLPQGDGEYLFNMINNYLDMADSIVKLNFTFNFDGILDNMGIKVNLQDMCNADLSILFNSGMEEDFEAVINNYIELFGEIDYLEIAKEFVGSQNSEDFVLGENGIVNYVSTIENNYYYPFGDNSLGIESVVIKRIYTGYIDFKSPISLQVSQDCGDFVFYNINYYINATIIEEVTGIDYDGNPVELTNEERETILEYYSSRFNSSLNLYVVLNVSSGEILCSDNPPASLHNYVFDENKSTLPEGCSDFGKKVYYCTRCGEEKIIYYTNGHSLVIDTELLGDDCEDGVIEHSYCSVCGEIFEDETYYYHKSYETFIPIDVEDCCEKHVLYHSNCACGKEERYSLYSLTEQGYKEYISLRSKYIDGQMYYFYTCPDCGYTLYYLQDVERDDNCYVNDVMEYHVGKILLEKDDSEAVELDCFEQVEDFSNYAKSGTKFVSSLTLQGEYSYIAFTVSEESVYAISSVTNGIDPVATLYEINESGLNYLNQDDDSGEGRDFYITYNLYPGRVYVVEVKLLGSNNGYYGSVVGVTIEKSNTFNGKLDKEFKTFTFTRNYYQHDYREFLLKNPEGVSCEDTASKILRICYNCGDSSIIENSYGYHYTGRLIEIDLKDYGAKDGFICCNSCACGERAEKGGCFYENLNNYQTNSYYDGEKDIYLYVAESDGFIVARWEKRIKVGCNVNVYQVWEIGYNQRTEQSQYTYEKFVNSYSEHTYKVSASLIEGAITCEEGVLVTYTCCYCGESYDENLNYHFNYNKEIIDLSEYGCVCGGELAVYGCACGENYYVHNEGHYCDLGGQYVYYNSDNDNLIVYKCAVTDPKCGCCYAIKNYYTENSCGILVYNEYRFGCDENGENPAKTISFLKYSDEYHDYKYDRTEKISLGNCLYRYTEISICTRCNKESRYSYEEYDHAKQLEFSDGCYKLYTCIECGQKIEQYEHDKVFVLEQEASCSQCRVLIEKCQYCNEILHEDISSPNGHNFIYNEEKGLYVCTECGLENINGANGDIILEDCSYDNTIKIGYYLEDYYRNEFSPMVVLLLKDESLDNRYVVVDVNMDDTYYEDYARYITFSKTDVRNCAENLGYSDEEYYIMFAFVPNGGGVSNEYAIILN